MLIKIVQCSFNIYIYVYVETINLIKNDKNWKVLILKTFKRLLFNYILRISITYISTNFFYVPTF